MRLLRPAVHRLLVSLLPFVQQDVDDLRIGHITVALEFSPNHASNVVRMDIEGVQRHNLWSLLALLGIDKSQNDLAHRAVPVAV